MAPTDRSGSPSKGNASVQYPQIPPTTTSIKLPYKRDGPNNNYADYRSHGRYNRIRN